MQQIVSQTDMTDPFPTFLLEKKDTFEDIWNDDFLDSVTNEGFVHGLILARNGKYLIKGHRQAIISCTPVDSKELNGLGDGEKIGLPAIDRNFAKLDLDLFRAVQIFFYEAYNKFKTEVAVVLYYHPERRVWQVLYPIQVGLSGAAVTYIINESERTNSFTEDMKKELRHVISVRNKLIADGFMEMGTIHSHCNFSAFHSGVDDSDELSTDGLHITIGDILKTPSYAQRICSNKCFLKLENITDVVDGTLEEIQNVLAGELDNTAMDRCYPKFGFNSMAKTGHWVAKQSQFNNPYYKSNYPDTPWWNTTAKEVFEPKEEIRVWLGRKQFDGIILKRCKVDEDFYYIKTNIHQYPVYANEKDIFPKTFPSHSNSLGDIRHLL